MSAAPLNDRCPETALETARLFRDYGLWPIDVPFKTKGPHGPEATGWHERRYEWDDIERIWGTAKPLNVGLLNGLDVGQIVDGDWDSSVALKAAEYFMPPTEMRWGRDTRPNTHWEYHVTDAPEGVRTIQFKDPTWKEGEESEGHKGMLCELIFNKQALAPGSVHPDGTLVRFELDAYQPPSDSTLAALRIGMGKCAAVALLKKYWVTGRHDMTGPLSGMLCRGKMAQDQAEQFLRVLCEIAGDDEVENRLAYLRSTYERAEHGENYTGARSLEEDMPQVVVIKLREWLQLEAGAYSDQTGPDGFALSDIGNAERFAERWRGKAAWCDEIGEWYVYDTGKYWRIDKRRAVWDMAMETARAFVVQVNDEGAWKERRPGCAPREVCHKHAITSQIMKNIRSMLDLAKSKLAVELSEFDADPLLVNMPNGTLELHTSDGEVFLREHRSSDLITHMTYGEYRPGFTHIGFEEYKRRFIPEPERWAFIQEALGASLPGTPKRRSIGLIGATHTGKSMTLRMGWKAFGTYATSLDPASLKADEHGGDRPRSDLLDLRGKRFVVMPEVGSGAVFDGALFKSMFSGGDRKKMRGQHQRHAIDMEFTHMLWSSGNRPYGVSSEDDATWNERFCFVRFEHQVPADDRDDREEDSIVNSVDACSAFITAAVEGFTRLYRDKRGELAPPDFIQHETDTVRETLDPYTAILEPGDPDEQMVEFTGNRKDGVLASELWFWVKDARSEQLGGRMRRVNDEKYAFGQAMIRRKAKLVRSQSRFGNKEYWRGVRWVEGFAKRAGVTAPDWTDEGASDDDEKAT